MFPGLSRRVGWQCWGELRLFFDQFDKPTFPWNSNTWIVWQHLIMLGLCLANSSDQPCHVSRREITWSYLTKSLWLLRYRRCQEVLLSKISRSKNILYIQYTFCWARSPGGPSGGFRFQRINILQFQIQYSVFKYFRWSLKISRLSLTKE